MFDMMVWVGAALSVIGLAGLILSILRVARARRTATSDDALREAIQKARPLNLGALLLSVLGLMLVIVGVFLG